MTTCPDFNLNNRRRRASGLTAYVVVSLLLYAHSVRAAGDDDALNLESSAVAEETSVSNASKVYVEFALGHADRRIPPPSQTLSRASLDHYLTGRLAPGWKGVLSNRLDVLDPAEPGKVVALYSLREAYASWSNEAATWVADVGRINTRLGAGYGYNPTDFFRDGSLRTFTTANPVALRENRMGSVVLRGQRLWQGGSVSIAFSPKLGNAPSGDTFSLDLGSTNSRNRGMLVLGLQPSERVSVQLALYKADGLNPQPGVSLTALLSDAFVAHGEWSAAREPSLADYAWGVSGHSVTGRRFAGGLTFTSATKLSLTAEFQANGFALSQTGWGAAAATNPALLDAYLREAQRRQDLPSRRAWLLYATQRDLGRKNLDLTAFVQYNPDDDSRVAWLELRQRWTNTDLALQVQDNAGRSGTVYGILPERRSFHILLARHFQ